MSGTRADRPQLAAALEISARAMCWSSSPGSIVWRVVKLLRYPQSIGHASTVQKSPSLTVAESWLPTVVSASC